MQTLFDYLDPERTEAPRRAQRDDAAQDRARKENVRRESCNDAATPFADERRELLASLSEVWATKNRPARVDVLDGCPVDITPGLARRPRTPTVPVLSAWVDLLPVMLVSSLLLLEALVLITG